MTKWLIIFAVLCCPTWVVHSQTTGIRGTFFDYIDNPWNHPDKESDAVRLIQDGLLIIENGRIHDFGHYKNLKGKYPNTEIKEFKNRIILPGFIDCQVHYPETTVVAAYGTHIQEWLEEFIFPEELKFKNLEYATKIASQFFGLMLKSGTTTVQSFATTAPESVTAFFNEATKRNMRVICGLTGLDRKGQAPLEYLDSAQSFYANSKALIEKYHAKGRNLYAISPRFALGSTKKQLEMCQKLKQEYPDCWVHSHVAETPKSTRLALTAFPENKDILSIYETHGLVGPKFTAGDAIYLSEDEFARLAEAGGSIAFSPSSNLLLGSGLFQLGICTTPGKMVRLGLGTDITFSLLSVLNEAYKVGMLNNLRLLGSFNLQEKDIARAKRNILSPYRGLYLATLGGAKALYLDHLIGSFDQGKEADFIVIDPNKGALGLAFRQEEFEKQFSLDNIAGELFELMMLGDDRSVEHTYIMGKLVHP